VTFSKKEKGKERKSKDLQEKKRKGVGEKKKRKSAWAGKGKKTKGERKKKRRSRKRPMDQKTGGNFAQRPMGGKKSALFLASLPTWGRKRKKGESLPRKTGRDEKVTL